MTFDARPGDTLVLYSDGITDHQNASGQEFGRVRLAHIVRSHCHLSAAKLTAAIFNELDKFSTTAFDDQTVMTLKVR